MQPMELFSQNFIFFVTYKWEIIFVFSKPFQPCVMKHSSLSGPFVSYEENDLLWMQPLELFLQDFIFFVAYQ